LPGESEMPIQRYPENTKELEKLRDFYIEELAQVHILLHEMKEDGRITSQNVAPKPPKRATPIPKDYWPDEFQLSKMKHECPKVQMGTETLKFINYYIAHGKAMKNWDACWRNWILKAQQYAEAG
jgi:hypothetical protein